MMSFKMGFKAGAISLLCLFFLTIRVSGKTADSHIYLTPGLFVFSQPEFREIYGYLPLVGVTMDFFFRKNFGLSAGCGYLAKRGQALVISGQPEELRVRFERLFFPFLLKWRHSLNRLQLEISLGAVYSSFREKWEQEPLSYQGNSFHFRSELALNYLVKSRFYFRVSLTGETIPTKANSPALNGKKANLAGWSFQTGVGYRIK